MINLALPNDTQNIYYILSGHLIGPFSPSFSDQSQVIDLSSRYNSLIQGEQRYHENNVEHVKLEGELNFNPAITDITMPFPTNWNSSNYWKCKPYGSASSSSQIVGLGLWRTGFAGITNNPSYHYIEGTIYDYTIYEVYTSGAMKPSVSTQYAIYANRYFNHKLSGTSVALTCRKSPTYYSYIGKYITSWSDLNIDVIKKMIGESRVSGVMYDTSQTYALYVPWTKTSVSVSGIVAWLDDVAYPTLAEVEPTLVEKSYGELAHDASQKVNANHVNMIAFLRDLRHPTEMIPKLKNLQKLRDHAGNLLTVEYGILPTISDLKSIWNALKGVAPYVDRNGFSTYSAGSIKTEVVGGFTNTLEQHIKLAIENEDSDLIKLVNSIESAGFAPTLQNLWDLVPYSFVIDWFVNVGDFLERIDTRLRLARMNIRYATMSRKVSSSMTISPSNSPSLTGTLKLVRYSRWTNDQCPVPPLFSQNASPDFSHWLEAGALIVQRTKY